MKNKIFIFFFLFIPLISLAQEKIKDSLNKVIAKHKGDTNEVNALVYLQLMQTQHDSTTYADQGLLLAKKLNYKRGEANCLLISANQTTNLIKGILLTLNALKIYEEIKDLTGIASSHLVLQGCYWNLGDYDNALMHAFSGNEIAEINNLKGILVYPGSRLAPLFLAEIGQIYLLKNKLDSAEFFAKKVIASNEIIMGAKWGFPFYLLASIQTLQADYKSALNNFRAAIPLSVQNGFANDTIQIFAGMSTLFQKINELDSAIFYAQKVEKNWNNVSEFKNLLEALNTLAISYKLKNEKDSTLKYTILSHAIKDSIYSIDKDRELQNITFNEQMKHQDIIAEQSKYKSKIQLYTLLAGLFVLLLVAGILWRNNRNRQKAYALLEKQKKQTDIQKMKVEHTLEELKTTQSQLIQSEKMASLGELTAGIAHEIQNPLNFVNNFSEVNRELIEELKEEAKSGHNNEVIAIADDISANEEKINHHGKRADAIVKGMLQHSRASTGVKEPTDINALADEYLRLSYYGLRAKDKSFNGEMKTDFDNSIGKINIIPQDIGRVLLNLYNNAFYAVTEKKKQQPENYDPTVSISTKKMDDKVLLTVKDNGNGIPQNIANKIFQPFFSTKPTGEGTGLGLSLSYDIIKVHAGELKMDSKEGEGTEFTITLPIS